MNFLQELTMAVALKCQRFMASLQTHGTSDCAREAGMDSSRVT